MATLQMDWMEYTSDALAQAAYVTSANPPNWVGTGADGDVTISSNTQLTSSQDSDIIVKNYNSLVVNSSCTLNTSNRCKGLLIYVKGNLTVNGTISMSSLGAAVDPVAAGVSSTGLRIIRRKTGSTDTLSASDLSGCGSAAIAAEANQSSISGNGKIYTIPRSGGTGGAAVSHSSGNGGVNGNPGNTVSGAPGGGGSGGVVSNTNSRTSGKGGLASCFSGGSGGGASLNAGNGTDAADNGGLGGSAGNGLNDTGGGGAGNPAGSGSSGGQTGGTGTGGLLIIIVGGNISIGATGKITADGAKGGDAGSGYDGACGGGASGGGKVLILYEGTYSNSGTVTASGGAAGVGSGGGQRNQNGGAGGAGDVVAEQIDTTAGALQSYSGSIISPGNIQGSNSLKCISNTSALNATLTKTISPTYDLTGVNTLQFDMYTSRTGANIQLSLYNSSSASTISITPNIVNANNWQTCSWDLNGVSTANKNSISKIIVTITEASSSNTFYIDNFQIAQAINVFGIIN